MSPLLFKRLSDESLGCRLASGEAAAFDELYRRYSNRLAAYGSHLLGDAGSGDDVAQATMLKAYAALRKGRVPNHMKPWLFRIAHNVAIDLVVRRRELPSDDLPEAPSIDREPFAGALVEALATLPDRQRRVYVLREVHGLRIDETAAELGLTAEQVEQSLFAARNRLAEQLVFGDRVNCVTVQRLAAGPLDTSERRALKTHFRTCHSCRETAGLRGRALTILPGGVGLEWLRNLGTGLVGAGSPAAAKVGAVVATATIVGGGTVAVDQTGRHHAHRAELRLVRTTPVAHAALPPSVARTVQVVALTAPARRLAVDRRGKPKVVSEDHEAQQVAEPERPASNDGAVETGNEHTTTMGSEGPSQPARPGSQEHSGTSSETRPGAPHPAETQQVEPQATENTATSSDGEAATSNDVTAPELSGANPD